MRKIVFLLIALIGFYTASFAVEFTVGGIRYATTSDTTVKVMDSIYVGAIFIPDTVVYSGVSYAVTAIGDSAFYQCFDLTLLSLPDSIKTIGDDAFSGCTGLQELYINTVNPPTLGNNVFFDVPASIPVYVPCGALTAYQADTNWNVFFTNMQQYVVHSLVLQSNDAGKGTTSLIQYSCASNTASFKASTNTGSLFLRWSDSNTDSVRKVAITSDTIFTAIFASLTDPIYTLSILSNDSGVGYVSANGNFTILYDSTLMIIDSSGLENDTMLVSAIGSGSYIKNTEVWLTATPEYGYLFSNWTSGEDTLSDETPFPFIIMSDTEIVANFIPEHFIVSTGTNDASYGIAIGGGAYPYKGQVFLDAIAEYGYRFSNWTSNGVVISDGNVLVFILLYDTSIIANFVVDTFHVPARANDNNWGSVSGNGGYPYDTEATLIATPQHGYVFVNWTSDNTILSYQDTLRFTVTGDVTDTIIANFVPNTFMVYAMANDVAFGSASGSNTYSYTAQATLSATPQHGYLFANWTSNSVILSTNNPFVFTVTDDTLIIAHFIPDTFSVSLSTNNPAFGSANGDGRYAYTEQATLTATPQHGYLFDHWTTAGNTVSIDNPLLLTIRNDTSFVAHFVPDEFAVLASPANVWHGSISGGNTYYTYNTPVTLTAIPEYGYLFDHWTSNSIILSTNNPFIFTITDDTTILAHFIPDTFTVALSSSNPSFGNVSGGNRYSYSTQASLSATPQYGYIFKQWTSNGIAIATANPFLLTVTSDTNILALFVPDTFIVSATANNVAYGSVSGSNKYHYTAQTTLTATPQYGYIFKQWTSNGIVVSTANPFIFTITRDSNLVATFVPDSFTISATANNALYGNTSGSNDYLYATQATLTAIPQYGYRFSNWTSGASVLSSNNPFTFTVTRDSNLIANFVPKTFTVSATANPVLYGSVSGNNDYPYTTQATLTATPQYGYIFSNWTSKGIVLSTDNPFLFTVMGDTEIVANFVLDTFIVSVSVGNAAMGSVSGDGAYPYLAQASLTATANAGYVFDNWTRNGISTVISITNPLSFTVTSDTTYIANFVPAYTVSVSANNPLYGTVSGGRNYPHTAQATLTATPQYGYRLDNWTSKGIVIATANPFTFTVTGDTTLVANFVLDSFTVSLSANNALYGTISGNGKYAYNTQATLRATANTGYVFTDWMSWSIVISTDNPFTFTVTGDTNFIANFKVGIGISETAKQTDLLLYPNPIEEILYIQSAATIEQLTICDPSGRIVKQVHTPTTNAIAVPDLAAGIYFIRIQTNNGMVIRKMVKQ